MKPDSRSTTFRRLAEQLREGCQRRGIQLDDGVAELIVAEHINAVAATLRVTDHQVMRTYLSDDIIEQIVARCERARTQQQAEVDLASLMLLPIPHAATIIGALAASCQAATTAEHRTETVTAILEATSAILRIAGAIARAGDAGPAILDAETAVIAHTQLSTMAHHLTDGVWHLPGHEQLPDAREHDLSMANRIQRDLQLLR
jgi:hypothetical protein